MGDVVQFPGAGIPPAPALPANLDGIGDRYTELLEARVAGDGRKVRLLEAACADDVPTLRELIHVQQIEIQDLRSKLGRPTCD